MATARTDMIPPVRLQRLDDLSDFHVECSESKPPACGSMALPLALLVRHRLCRAASGACPAEFSHRFRRKPTPAVLASSKGCTAPLETSLAVAGGRCSGRGRAVQRGSLERWSAIEGPGYHRSRREGKPCSWPRGPLC